MAESLMSKLLPRQVRRVARHQGGLKQDPVKGRRNILLRSKGSTWTIDSYVASAAMIVESKRPGQNLHVGGHRLERNGIRQVYLPKTRYV